MRSKALVLLVALTATACAGEVGKYRNAAAGSDVAEASALGAQAAEASAQPVADAGQGGGAVTVDPAGGAAGTAVPATGAATLASPAGGPVTTVSGPAARLARPAAAGGAAGGSAAGARIGSGGGSASTASAAGGGPAGGSGATSSGSGSPAAATSAGSGGAPAPAPVAPGGGTTTGVTKDTVTIGVFYPKSGAYAGVARNAPAVAEAAFNEAGPINGRRVVLKYYDDGTANASTIQVEEKRAKNEVFALMSVVGESNVVLAPLADQHKIPLVIGNIDRKVALPLTHVFAVYPYWAHQATILPGFIKNVLGGAGKKIGVVYEGTTTAIDAKNAFKEKAKDLGLNVMFEQPIAQNQSTCANEVSNFQSRGVEVVFMMNGPLGGICMLRDAKALGYRPTWTGVNPSWGFNVVAQASGGGADGIRMIRVTPTLESPEGRHYTETMKKFAPNSGAENDDLLLIFYALLRSFIEGLRRAGPDLTREGLVQTWETKMNGYDSGYLPPPTFGPRDRSGPLLVGIGACCTNGRWTTPQPGWRAAF